VLTLETVTSLVSLIAEIAAKGQKTSEKRGGNGRKSGPQDG
jgi:hypothetical protein